MLDYLSLRMDKRDMNIKPQDKTIKELLLSEHQFVIPRFQREYSWEKKHYKEFLDDMLDCLIVNNGNIIVNQYFLGTMLFVGDCFESDQVEIFVVDGQQRLTTITILFSALSDRFLQLGEEKLSKQVFRYIMTENDDGEQIRIIKSKTHYPFFSFYIQDRKKEVPQEPNSEEEEAIKEAFEYLYNNLDEQTLRAYLKKRYGSDEVDKLTYISILKAIRDQVLGTTFVSISTKERKQANMIFEILNAKGKNLTETDLIKNKIFEIVDDIEPADYAEEKWKVIKNILNTSDTGVGFVQFYRHFWISKYKKSSMNKLYDDFKTIVKPKTKERYKLFLQEIENTARLYIKIVDPKRSDFDNRKEYFGVVQSLNALTNYFNIVQVRIALIALLEAKENSLITLSQFKNIVYYLDNFHFAYNAVGAKPTNKLETIYSRFAIKLRASNNKEDVKEIISDLIDQLDSIYISYSDFEDKFVLLTYSKKENPSNLKTKYAINKIACYYEGSDVFDDEGSVEHILSETESDKNINIGNLILLERRLNQKADNLDYVAKTEIYRESTYKWVQSFLSNNAEWNNDKLTARSKKMAAFYYTKILGKQLPSDEVGN